MPGTEDTILSEKGLHSSCDFIATVTIRLGKVFGVNSVTSGV